METRDHSFPGTRVLVKVFLVFSCVKKGTKKLLCLVYGLELCDMGQECRGLLEMTQRKKQLMISLMIFNQHWVCKLQRGSLAAEVLPCSAASVKCSRGICIQKTHAGWFTQQIVLTDSILNGKCGSIPAASSWPSGLLCVWHALIQL